MKYKYEYRSVFNPDENETFDTEQAFRDRFRNAHSMFGIFIDEEKIDMMTVVLGPESYTLYRVHEQELIDEI